MVRVACSTLTNGRSCSGFGSGAVIGTGEAVNTTSLFGILLFLDCSQNKR